MAKLFLALFLGSALAAPAARQANGWPSSIACQVHGPEWPQFVNATTRWSTYSAPTFDEIFLPRTGEDLAVGLQYLSSIGKPYLAMSGGHGYAPSLGEIQNATMINMRNFNYVNVHEDGTATIGSGTKFRDVINGAYAAGREITVGNCPCVGSIGAMLGGGLGRLQGEHALTSDALRAVNMVLWNGTRITASETEHADLFWGLRGAGQNFGIVYEGIFETYEQTNGGNHYIADIAFHPSNLSAVIGVTDALWENWDSRLAIITAFGVDPASHTPLILVNIVFAGPEEEGRAIVAQYLPLAIAQITDETVTWPEVASTALMGGIEAGCATGARSNSYNVMVRRLDRELLPELFASFAEFVTANPLASTSTVMIESFAQQAVQALPDDYSAFPHRRAFNNAIVISANYFDDAVAEAAGEWALSWRNRINHPEITGFDTFHVYQNYANDDEPLSALYGVESWRHERLTALKNAYDPHGMFNGYHAIPTTLADWS
ncbi:hypothetical protein B0I35DRAFT_363902 [Stachybotrys elegans]|uniref:FAD-binding PCMH-type domain-containing protein n=1 Tax=Stachybotrys elegans TaxID=80388 RepID=A0A8K0WKI6_9HYPO|nr:hypothetical protein B0I35DRAFT_363902 [Stachybotrys elegans]